MPARALFDSRGRSILWLITAVVSAFSAETSVSTSDVGVTVGIVNTAQRVGSGLGISALLLAHATGCSTFTPNSDYRTGLTTAFAAGAAAAPLGSLPAWTALRVRPATISMATGPSPNLADPDTATRFADHH